jgi:hypothetical protein
VSGRERGRGRYQRPSITDRAGDSPHGLLLMLVAVLEGMIVVPGGGVTLPVDDDDTSDLRSRSVHVKKDLRRGGVGCFGVPTST